VETSDGVQLRILSRELAAVEGSALLLGAVVSFNGCGGVLINNRSSLQANTTNSTHLMVSSAGLPE